MALTPSVDDVVTTFAGGAIGEASYFIMPGFASLARARMAILVVSPRVAGGKEPRVAMDGRVVGMPSANAACCCNYPSKTVACIEAGDSLAPVSAPVRQARMRAIVGFATACSAPRISCAIDSKRGLWKTHGAFAGARSGQVGRNTVGICYSNIYNGLNATEGPAMHVVFLPQLSKNALPRALRSASVIACANGIGHFPECDGGGHSQGRPVFLPNDVFEPRSVNGRFPGTKGNLPWVRDRTRRSRNPPNSNFLEVYMKMVKSLLLGSAAGLVAIAGAQAADLPVKAKAVEYVKVCSLYGAGFYYIPGTDICLKVGGHVRADVGYNGGSSLTTGPFASGWNNRVNDNPWVQRSLYYASFDARSQTAYGTARAYMTIGSNSDWPNSITGSPYLFRGFIQWAGFTFGQAQSFFDFHNHAAYQYTYALGNDTVPSGWRVIAYTAQFGGGFSATVSLEEPRRTTITTGMWPFTAAVPFLAAGGPVTYASMPLLAPSNQSAIRFPDVVANLRIDQAWGSAQVMGALHDVSNGYNTGGAAGGPPGVLGSGSVDRIGWAVGAGVKVNLPSLGAGDTIALQGVYSVGAVRYANATGGTYNSFSFNPGNGTMGYGVVADATDNQAGTITLTTAWSVSAALEHFWRPDLKTSLWVNYLALDYAPAANAVLAGINSDWSTWVVGSRTEWAVSKQLSLGAEVAYHYLRSANQGGTYNYAAPGMGYPAAVWNIADQSEWSFRFRAQYNFVP